MLIGGLAFVVSMAVYYPLTLFFEQNVEFLGQVFYLPTAIPSTLISLVFGYYGNRKWTFNDCRAKQLSLLRYLITGMATAIGDIFLLFALVSCLHIFWLISSVVSVLVMFLVRYFISRYYIWGKSYKETAR